MKVCLTDSIAICLVSALLSVFVYEQAGDRSSERRSSTLDGLAGNVRSSAALAHSVWLDSGATARVVSLGDGQTVEIDLTTGYPVPGENGILALVPESDWLQSVSQSGATLFSISGDDAGDCHVSYALGETRGAPPRVSVRNNASGGDCGS